MSIINGIDPVSQNIINELNNGVKVKELPLKYEVSLDQAKKLSRLNNLLNAAKQELTDTSYKMCVSLGMKSLILVPLTKNNEWLGIEEILNSIDETITREELKRNVQALLHKNERIKLFQIEVNEKFKMLERKKHLLIEKKDEIIKLSERIAEQITLLDIYPMEVREFLINHLAVTPSGYICLSKRLDYNWQKSLQKKNIISFQKPPFQKWDSEYDQWIKDNQEIAYKYVINDVNKIAEEFIKRQKRGWECEWNYIKEMKRVEKNSYSNWNVPKDSSYKNIDGLSSDLSLEMEDIKAQIESINLESKTIQQGINNLRKSSPQSFIEQVEAANTLSQRELKKHGELQYKALKWLYQRGYSCVSELSLSNGKRVDVIGFNDVGNIIAIEVKVSLNDFLRDTKWERYLDYCDEFYFVLADELWFDGRQAGLLIESGKSLEKSKDSVHGRLITSRDEILFSVSRALSKKLVFGY
ncbi:MmcB family DNA repair protein [Fictibacillus nanhaiensis]|uniref:MmcB family DNA repair protein n=1 Tax=Fictibacillus nanhaiensis TaxID=742169 RepID=UPI002E1D29F9|nr:MmcB family DNA repair protein [Fictibacillus nanhaiensis]